MKLAELFVEIGGDLKPLNQSLSTARSQLAGMAHYAAQQGRAMSSGLFGGIGSAARRAAADLKLALVGTSVAAAVGLGYAVKKASDLNESINKARVAFGDAAEGIMADATAMGDRFGVAKQDFVDASTEIGLIGKAAGMSGTEAAGLGRQFAKLASDAASFYNVSLDDALLRIRSGLVGEAEPLRRFGVLLDETTVQNQVMAMGLAKTTNEITQQQKVLARAALITNGMRDASGDLERTQDQLANRLREVWGRIQNMATALGEQLLPLARELASVAVQAIQGLSEWLRSNQSVIAGWVQSLRDAVTWLKVLVTNAGLVKTILREAVAGWRNIFGELFESLRHNFAELARFFGQSLTREVQNALDQKMLDLMGVPKQGLGGALLRGFFAGAKNELPILPPQFKGVDLFKEQPGAQAAAAQLQNQFEVERFKRVFGEIGDKIKDGAQTFRRMLLGPQQVAGQAPPGRPQKPETDHRGPMFSSLEDFARRLQEGALGKEDAAKKTAEGVQQLVGIQQQAVQLQKQAIQKQQNGAVWAPPA